MPGVTVDGGDPSRSATSCMRPSSARSGEGPTLVESLVYRLSAHGNIIAPARRAGLPGHEAIHVFGNVEEYEAAQRGTRASPRAVVTDGVLTAEQADAIGEAAQQGCRRRSSSGWRARSRRRRRPSSSSTPEEVESGARFPTSRRSARPSIGRWRATKRSSTSGRTSRSPRTTRT